MTLANLSTMSDSLVLFSSDDEESDYHYETKQYENFTAMLKGVPPPSSITISKFTVEEMLQKYEENKESFGFGLKPSKTNFCHSKNPVPFLKYSNTSQLSENIASAAQKVQERYVQIETMSSCNVWFKTTLESCGSAKKRLRMRQCVGLSPGRRLSHLARRRQFFSSANLQRLATTENVRQIEIKRNSDRGNGRKNLGRIVESEKLKSSKRALFLSPENETPTKYGNAVAVDRKNYSSGSDERRKLPLQERSKKVEVLKWLSQQNFEVDFPRKRLREECVNHSVERKRKCPRRSLNFADDDVSSNVATSDSNNSTDKKTSGSGKLSEIHKNKLLWAISVVLRENDITQKDEHFKSLAAKLFFTCRTNLDEILSLNTAEGTSDKILHFARKIIPSIFKELGIKPKLSAENSFKAEIKCSDSGSQLTEESKENINGNNLNNQNRSLNYCHSEVEFVFKTPVKIRQRRIVKSCHKAPNSGRKRKEKVMRRWRSLELLIEDAVQSSVVNQKNEEEVSKEKHCESVENGNNFNANENVHSTVTNIENSKHNADLCATSDTPLLTSDVIESDGTFCVPSCVIPCLPSIDTTVIFSPIPSSVQEESENVLYPSLCVNQTTLEETEYLSDGNDSMEIVNQDEDLGVRIETLEKGGVFPENPLKKIVEENSVREETVAGVEDNITVHENPLSSSPIENPNIVNEVTESYFQSHGKNNEEAVISRNDTYNDEKRTEDSIGMNGFSCGSDGKIDEKSIMGENENERGENDFKPDANGNNEIWEPLTPECIARVEKGTYKPRKLIVKKSKPNWKVVTKDADEADNECDLRLKMRLSHEWEIVCRNSSCSDIGNNSEYETTSMNCSQVSSGTDKEVSSENEAENSLRRSSAQSKHSESTEEELTNSNTSSENNDLLEINESNHHFNSGLSSTEEDRSKCNLTVQNPSILFVSAQGNNMIQVDELDNTEHREESFDKTDDEDSLRKRYSRMSDANVAEETHHEGDFLAREGTADSENEELCRKMNSNSYGAKIMHRVKISTEKRNRDKGEKLCFDGDIPCETSPILFLKSRSVGKSSKKRKRQGNFRNSPEAEVKEEDCSQSGTSGELEQSHCDSESGNSSASNCHERKKILLSLENYKARKLEEASNEIKLKASNEHSEPKEILSEEKNCENSKKKKIYNIRLKHPVGYHRHKRKHKHKDCLKETERKHKLRENERKKSVSAEGVHPEAFNSPNSGLHLYSLHQLLNSVCGNDPSGEVDLSDGVKRSMRNEVAGDISESPVKEVNIQTIVDALSALSNLVQEQIKLESDKMSAQNESGENTSRKSKWLDVVLSWCGKNLSNLKRSSNASDVSINGLDDGSAAAVRTVLSLGGAESSESIISTADNETLNKVDYEKISSFKTECNRSQVEDCIGHAPSKQMNFAVNAACNNNPSLVNPDTNFSHNSTISSGIRSMENDSQTVKFQNYSIYSGNECIGPQSNAASYSHSETFNTFGEVQGASAADDCKLFNQRESKGNVGCFDGQQNSPKGQPGKDPRYNANHWAKPQRICVDNPDDIYGGSSKYGDCGRMNSVHSSNLGEYASSAQTPDGFSNNYPATQKPWFYHPNLYSNYPDWQMAGDGSSWNYHGNLMSDPYQNSYQNFYPFQMSNVPYYFNKY